MGLGAKQGSARADAVGKASAGMSVRFWGVRGGIASAGEETLKFGGNTPCVEIRAGGETFVLDCGTGARELGRELMARAPVKLFLLFSDYRWDHLQGFPFFTPVYIPTSEIHVFGPFHGEQDVRTMLADQMKFPVFPIQMEHLHARFQFSTLAPGGSFRAGSVQVSTLGAGESLFYRIDDGTRSFVYVPEIPAQPDAKLIAFCRKASALVVNSSVPASLNGAREKATKAAWDSAVRLARDSKAKRLVLFHHAPDDDDRALIALERRAKKAAPTLATHAAYEGLKLAL